MNEGEVHY